MKSKINYRPLLVSLIIFCSLVAQPPDIAWQNTIGGIGYDYFESIRQTADGGYILGGYSDSGISGDKTETSQGDYDYWAVKLDNTGQTIEWQNTIGGSGDDYLKSIQQTTDGGYILGGYSVSETSGDKTEANQGSFDYWVVKLDGTGNIVWQNTIGGSDSDYLQSIQQTTDGGYILGGYSMSGISGDKIEANLGGADYWVIKLDSAGNIVWQNTIGGSNTDYLFSIQQITDGGYILGGNSYSGVSGDKTEASQGGRDYWVVKLDGVGNIVWQNTIGGSNDDFLYSIRQITDGTYILGGYSKSEISGDKTEVSQGDFDYWVVKLDGVGNVVWQNTIGGSNVERLYSIRQTADGGYILGGRSESGISGDKTEGNLGDSDYWVVKLDNTGQTIEWQYTIGGSESDYLFSTLQTTDGGYILGGYSRSGISGAKTEESQGSFDYWVVKLAPDNPLAVENYAGTSIVEKFRVLPVYPNPFNPSTTITYGIPSVETYGDASVHISIYDITGKFIITLLNSEQTPGWHTVIWNGTNQQGELVPTGLYLSRIISGYEVKTTKLMLLR